MNRLEGAERGVPISVGLLDPPSRSTICAPCGESRERNRDEISRQDKHWG